MTTNIERTAVIIREIGPLFTAYTVARNLAGDGLITPDLPEPIINADDGNLEWHADEYTVDVDRGMVGLWTPDGTHWEQTPNHARDLANILNAAANHADEVGTE